MLLLVLLLAAALPIHILRSPLPSACRDGRMMLMRDVLMSSPQHTAIVAPGRAALLRSGPPQDPGLLLFIYTLMNYVQPWNLARVYSCPRAADRQSRRSNKVRLPDLSLIVSPPSPAPSRSLPLSSLGARDRNGLHGEPHAALVTPEVASNLIPRGSSRVASPPFPSLHLTARASGLWAPPTRFSRRAPSARGLISYVCVCGLDRKHAPNAISCIEPRV